MCRPSIVIQYEARKSPPVEEVGMDGMIKQTFTQEAAFCVKPKVNALFFIGYVTYLLNLTYVSNIPMLTPTRIIF